MTGRKRDRQRDRRRENPQAGRADRSNLLEREKKKRHETRPMWTGEAWE